MSRRPALAALLLALAFAAWTAAMTSGALAPLDSIRTPLGPDDPWLGWWLLVARVAAPGWVYLAVLVVALPGWRSARPYRLLATAAGALATYAAERLLKEVFARPRPPWQLEAARLSNFAYPSGHAAAAGFVLGLVATGTTGRFARTARWGAGLGAAVVAADRWLLGNHYPSDIAAGLLLGAAIGAAAMAAAGRAEVSRPRG